MNRMTMRMIWLLALGVLVSWQAGCGLTEGIYTARDEGQSTSQFRYQYELIPSATVMREDTQPRWQLGRYVFVRGADQVLVVSRITSWSDTASRSERDSGQNISGMKDRMLERLWITIPQGAAIGEELDLHALSSRFMVNYDRGDIGDKQFAHPFRALGNIRILSENKDSATIRLRLRLTTDQTTAWEVFEDSIKVSKTLEGHFAKQADAGSILFAVSRPGEIPTAGIMPVPVTAEMTSPKAVESRPPATAVQPADTQPSVSQAAIDQAIANANLASQTPPATQPSSTDSATVQGDQSPSEKPVNPMIGKWYNRSVAWEVYLQLRADGSFIHSASRPQGVPIISTGQWQIRSGYLVLQVKSLMAGQTDQMKLRQDNPYALLKINWKNNNTVELAGDMPPPDMNQKSYNMRRAVYPDLNLIPPSAYRPGEPAPLLVETPNGGAGEQPGQTSGASGTSGATSQPPAGSAPAMNLWPE